MKKFNTLQELWSYCLFCPLCQDMTRDITVVAGPYDVVAIMGQSKDNEFLKIETVVKLLKQRYSVNYYIDCVRNVFTISVPKMVPSNEESVTKASSSVFFFSLISNCEACGNTSLNSSDIELDILSKKISNFGVDMEGIYLLEQKTKYHLTLNHSSDELLVSKCFEDDSGTIIDDNKVINLPLTHFDFSKPKKVLNRIRTFLVFS